MSKCSVIIVLMFIILQPFQSVATAETYNPIDLSALESDIGAATDGDIIDLNNLAGSTTLASTLGIGANITLQNGSTIETAA